MSSLDKAEHVVVISGISGKGPNSDNLAEYKHQIYNKMDMIGKGKRFAPIPGAPERSGNIPTVTNFDGSFFSSHMNNIDVMDPAIRMSMEMTCEALWDAGISLEELKGAKVCIASGRCFNDYQALCTMHTFPNQRQVLGMTSLCMGDIIAHFLQCDGPKLAFDSGCSSSMYSMEYAFQQLKTGKVDYAIVIGISLLQSPCWTSQLMKLGVLSKDGSCKAFDRKANGYVRSDTVAILILQRAEDARRHYAEIVHVKTNCDGYKEEGITFPLVDGQRKLYEEFYSKCNIPLDRIGFFEAHGTGTNAGDPVELKGVENYLCRDRQGPLLIGSIKSNLGHAEGAAGINSLIKCCWILTTNKIPPNIHFYNPHSDITGLFNGKLEVVTDIVDLPEDKPYVAVNSFGFGGANGHILLRKPRHQRKCMPPRQHFTRILCISGRTEDGIMSLFQDLNSRPYDPDFISLLNSAFGRRTDMLNYKAVSIINQESIGPIDVNLVYDDPPELTCFFDCCGVVGLVSSLINFETFRKHLEQCRGILLKNKVEMLWAKTDQSSNELNEEGVLETLMVQTGIFELLKMSTKEISEYIGNGVGVLSAAYADGILSLEQVLILGHKLQENNNIDEVTMLQPPSKWHLPNNITTSENLDQYFKTALSSCSIWKNKTITNNKREMLLIIGGSHKSGKHSEHLLTISDKSAMSFLDVIGHLHLLGYDIDANSIFSVQWPVAPHTPMINPLVKWEHKNEYQFTPKSAIPEIKRYSINQWTGSDWLNIDGHNIDGRIIFPATGYLRLAWMSFCNSGETFPIKFENVSFLHACNVLPGKNLHLVVQLQKDTGVFQVLENDSIVVTGTIREMENFDEEWVLLPPMAVPSHSNVMTKGDIYKELRLRGYYYQGHFKEIQNCDISARVAEVKWTEWCPFLDNMMQLKLLAKDTRNLYFPTKISQMIIHPEKHLDIIYSSNDADNVVLTAYHYKELNVIRCGYVEIRGIETSSVARCKHSTPVLEVNKFVPYVTDLDLKNAARVMSQIVLENTAGIQFKAIEDFNNVPNHFEPILVYIQEALNDQPLVQPELTICTDVKVQVPISCIDRISNVDSDNLIAIGYQLSENYDLCKTLLSSLKNNGFLISREDLITTNNVANLTIICEYTTPFERIVMMKMKSTIPKLPKLIKVGQDCFDWIEPLKEARINKESFLLYSENEPKNGLIGLTNCLNKESGEEKIMSVLIDDAKASKFEISKKYYLEQVEKNLTINVLKDGVWGSYRYLLMDSNRKVETDHFYGNNAIKGDLSSLTWMQGMLSVPENFDDSTNYETIYVYNSSLNFKDVMLASGKLQPNSLLFKDRRCQENLLGIECAGRKQNGQRVMAVGPAGMFSNMVQASSDSIWPIPDNWTMAQAATVPCVYLTTIYGLIIRAKIQPFESILIHSATGGVGMSAINIAMHYKSNIFVTVGTSEKKQYIMDHYPSILEQNIGNSRDTKFHEQILKQTNGQGVDIILNSLADEKLQASVKCLRKGGRFLEIGQFDCTQDTLLQIELTSKEAEYHGVMLDQILADPHKLINKLGKELMNGIAEGYVIPIPYKKYMRDEFEAAVRYMTTGNHIGKIVIEMRKEEFGKGVPQMMKCLARPKVYCNPKGTYVILGGLGGFGLELADFLILRGAKKLVLVSRHGITSGYQQLRLKIWKSYNCEVKISTEDCTTYDGCSRLLEIAKQMGEVIGIFNLAVVLRDAIFDNQSEETFLESYKPKAQSTIYLDQLSQIMCPKLAHFVVFSSISCGRGNAGQTNYGYSNSVMERVCEHRRSCGLPGKAIQWGIIADVGIAADYKERNVEMVFEGTMHQRVANCLENLDVIMTSDDTIVSSMILGEKQDSADDNIISVVCDLLQIKDIKTISVHSTFPELGMDSMLAIEIKKTLETDFELFLSQQELRTLNFFKLAELVSLEVDKTTDS